MTVRCMANVKNTLGESCVWDARSQSVYWTDIEEKRVYRQGANGVISFWSLPERCAFLFPRQQGGFVLGFTDWIARTDETFSGFERIVGVEENMPQTRLNDATVDPLGGLIFGTMNEQDAAPIGGVYRLASDGTLRKLLDGVAIANGLAFSPDGRLLYFTDTPDGRIRRFMLDAHCAQMTECDALAPADIAPGKPDGACVDSAGHYWNARVWGGCVVRMSPHGQVVEQLELPIPAPTCVCFGGEHLRTLYITSLRKRHTAEQLEQAPLAGGFFAVDVETPGQQQHLCAL